jgi:hypothetical protein
MLFSRRFCGSSKVMISMRSIGFRLLPFGLMLLAICCGQIPAGQAAEDSSFARDWRAVHIGGVISTPSVPQPKLPNDVVGLVLENSGAALRGRAITFGQVFVPGQVPRGSNLVATVAGDTLPTQLDVKATNPDGSVRMGIVTIAPARLAEGATPIMLSRNDMPAAAAFDLANIHNYVVTVDVAIGDRVRHLDAASLLAEGLRNRTASYWLRGPLASEVRVDAPIESSLHVTFDIRGYADGSTVTDIGFRNDYAFEPVGGTLDYAVTIKEGDAVALANRKIHQPQYTQWHLRVWSAAIPRVNVVHDVAALERSGAILDYDLNAGVATSLIDREIRAMNGPGFGLLESAGFTKYMGTTGGRADIGPTTVANTAWIMTQDASAGTYALAQADAAGSIPWHFFDRKLNNYRTATAFPNLWVDQRGGGMGTTGLTQPVTPYSQRCDCWAVDAGHQPDVAFVPYMFTGSRYYLDQLEAQSSWDILFVFPNYRLSSQGIVALPSSQVRSNAWELRGVVNAAWIVPDADPLKRYFEKIQENNFAYLADEIGKLREGEASGWLPGVYGSNDGAIAPWQEDYFASVIVLAAKRRVPHALDILKWETNFLAGRFLASDKGFYPYDGAAYNLYTYAKPSPISGAYQTWAEIGRATAAHGQSGGGDGWPKQSFTSYLQAARGVLAEIIILTGSPEATKALAWLVDHSPQAGNVQAQQIPTWNFTPREPN